MHAHGTKVFIVFLSTTQLQYHTRASLLRDPEYIHFTYKTSKCGNVLYICKSLVVAVKV